MSAERTRYADAKSRFDGLERDTRARTERLEAIEAERKAWRERAERVPFLREARSAFGIFGFPQVFALFLILTVGTMIVNSVLPFYLESAARVPASQQSLVLGLLFATAVAIRVLGRAGQSRRLLQQAARGAVEAARHTFDTNGS